MASRNRSPQIANPQVPTNLIAYTTDAAAPTGWTIYTALYGRFVVGFNTNIAGTVGTALTTLENRTHTHTGPSHQHLTLINSANPLIRTDSPYGGTAAAVAWYLPAVSQTGSTSQTYSNTSLAGTGATGTATTGDVVPFIQLLPIAKS